MPFYVKNATEQALESSDGAAHGDWLDWAELGMHFEARAALRVGRRIACIGGNDRTWCLGMNVNFEGSPIQIPLG